MIALEQGSQEWLDFRKTRIGASDATIIMGDSPWSTAYQLWEQKTGLREPTPANPWMQRGIDLEPIARECYIRESGNVVTPLVMGHHKHRWMIASLDGITEDLQHIVEIKCSGEKDHALAKSGIVPPKYYAQLQHQLEVSRCDVVDYFSYRSDDDFVIIQVQRDEEYILTMLEAEKAFWDKVQNFIEPEKVARDHEKQFIERFDEEWQKACLEKQLSKEQLLKNS